jgi:hypothetical protein
MDLTERRRSAPKWALSVFVLVVALIVGAVGEAVLQPGLVGVASVVESRITLALGSLSRPMAGSLRAPSAAAGTPANSGARPSSAAPATASPGPAAVTAPSSVPNSAPEVAVAQPFLGISYEQLSPQIASNYGISVTQGALVRTVEADSPADKAGVDADDVITAIDQTQLDAEHSLASALLTHRVGDTIEITVTRAQTSMTLTATLVQRPANT